MRKITAILLTLCFVLSAFSGVIFVNAEDASPVFTVSTKYWTQDYATVSDNVLFDSATLVNDGTANSGYVTVYSEPVANFSSYTVITDWLKNESSVLRFWIKTPWIEDTPEITMGFDIQLYTQINATNNYKHTEYKLSLPFDGLWHEVRINATSFNTSAFDSVLSVTETDVVTLKGFYVRIDEASVQTALSEGDGFYFTAIEFYTSALTSEINDGNVDRTPFVLDGERKDYVSTITMTKAATDPKVYDNKYIDSARMITRNAVADGMNSKIIMPYSANLTLAEGETENELAKWFNDANAEMRLYMKNDSNEDISFRIGLYGEVMYNSINNYPQLLTNNTITLEANSGWQEIRLSISDMYVYDELKTKFTTTEGFAALNICPVDGKFLQNEGDTLYVTPLEIYNYDIVEDVATSFDWYEEAGKMTQVYSSKNNTSGNILRENTDCSEMPFFSQSVTLTAVDTYDAASAAEKQIGIICNWSMPTEDFLYWLNNNPDAEMRFWVKSEKATTFKIGLQASNKEIYAEIAVEESDGWQEIRVKRSQFTNNSDLLSAFQNNTTLATYLLFYANDETLHAGDSIAFGHRVEFFSHEAYDKGDVTRDGAVDLKDLVRFKKLSADSSAEFINADIDSDNKLTATDISYLRTWIIKKVWH